MLLAILVDAVDSKDYSITSDTINAYNNINSNLSRNCHDLWPDIELFLPIHIAQRGHRNLGNFF